MKSSGKTENAYEVLKRAILNGTHAPGAPLRVAALSKAHGISATPLREALSRLEEKRLVVASPNCGWRVAPVSFEELNDLEDARLSLEQRLLDDAIAHAGMEWEADLVAAHHRLMHTPHPIGRDAVDDRERWIVAHDGFHEKLVAGGRSSWLKSFHAVTLEQLQRHHQALLFHPGSINPDRHGRHSEETLDLLRLALAHEHHTKLMQAALDRDRDVARALLGEHVQITMSVYRSVVGLDGVDDVEKRTKREELQ
ncbi:GntR family transcriptional regulator [Roseivivax isoporae]|uniref:GntR family transcriptional regulator n=1 Tax=Roseivivax isoporae LMG 25204 TaxID=1449351 RepID=X7F5V3_9RHOB|nr:GntR family transcriptional regulator [Roseivivax isoporae]ETX28098.1 GntR family transcriptional regulator [Roseivivax isoporae LMG 25204]